MTSAAAAARGDADEPRANQLDVLRCPHCAARVEVLAQRRPVLSRERDDGDERVFVMISGDNWLLHRCVIGGDAGP